MINKLSYTLQDLSYTVLHERSLATIPLESLSREVSNNNSCTFDEFAALSLLSLNATYIEMNRTSK